MDNVNGNELLEDRFADITNTLYSVSDTTSYTYSDSTDMDSDEEGSDISDALTSFRAPSRLGFSISNSLEDNKAEERRKWTSALFQNVSSEDTSSTESDVSHTVDVDLGFGSTSLQPTEDSDSASECSSDEDEDSTITPSSSYPSPADSHSTLRKPTRPPPAPPLILPPTSPCLIDHGLSKNALNHLKWFWAARHDEWLAWEAQVAEIQHALSLSRSGDVFDDDEAYGGIAILPSSLPKLTLPPPPSSSSPSRPPLVQNNSLSIPRCSSSARIHPRQGDISALRDPYCANVDMCFGEVPLWTMGKVLWGFDAEHRVGAKEQPQAAVSESAKDVLEREVEDSTMDVEVEPDDFEDVALGSEYSDSDLTLVSDSLPPTPTTAVGKTPCSPADSSSQYEEEEDDEFYTWDGVRAWEISWYARWEVLVELVRRDEVPFTIPASNSGQKEEKPMFFFAGEDGEEEEDEEEDYGTIMPNPMYGLKPGSGMGIGGMVQGIDVKSGAKVLCV